MDEKIKTAFFNLLQLGLWEKKQADDFAPLTEQEWLQLFRYACNHTVEGIIYDSLSLLRQELLPPRTLLLKWTVRIDQIERYNEKMNIVIAEQKKFFAASGLKPILQKGQGVARCYQNPKHRVCGDIDWCFEGNDYSKVESLLRNIGIEPVLEANYSLSYQWNDRHIEHHRKLFDICSPFKKPYLKNLTRRFRDKYQVLCFEGTEVSILPPELQLLQVNAHILKHLLSFGIGLRQICDAASLYYTYADQIDGYEMKKIYQEVGILKWIHLLHIILVKFLGMPKEYLPFPYPTNGNADFMLDEIWYSGNFGFYDERYVGRQVSAMSKQPDGPRRLWLNFKRYVGYTPEEAFFFPIVYTFSKFSMSKGGKK